MTGRPIAYAVVSGLQAYEAGAGFLCCGCVLLGWLQGIGSCSRSPLTGDHDQRAIPSGVPILGYGFRLDALSAFFNMVHALLVTALSVLFCRLPPGFPGANECRPINRTQAVGRAKPRVVPFGHRRQVS
jgi:hypothetical protein